MIHDSLNASVLRQFLGKHADGMQIQALKSCPSTNTLARETALDAPRQPILITAEQQTAGRGRLGRQFHSPSGSGVYFSLLYPLNDALPSAVSVTCAASVAVMRAIRRLTGLQVAIKWVNDLLLDGKKICGILTEAVTVGAQTSLIVGIGINLRPCVFPDEIAQIAGSLNQEELPRAELIAAVVSELIPFLQHPSDHSWLTDYRAHSCVLGRQILRVEEGVSLPCTAEAIDDNGGLWVRHSDGRLELLQTGEISIRF